MARMATIERPAERVRHAAERIAAKSKAGVESASHLPEKVPPPVYIGLAIGSIALALTLFARKKKETAIFVGLWPPTFLVLGLFAKLIGVREKGS